MARGIVKSRGIKVGSILGAGELKPEEVGYIAGIVDGEGCIMIGGQRIDYHPRIHITNTDLDLLRWIQKYLGGTIHEKKPTWHAYPSHRRCYNLTWSNHKELKWLAPLLLPWLRVKKRKAELVIEICKTMPLKLGGWKRWHGGGPQTGPEWDIRRGIYEEYKDLMAGEKILNDPTFDQDEVRVDAS